MLRKTVLTIAAMLLTLTASAEFRWGPTAGININKMRWKQDLLNTRTLTGPNAGLFGELMIPGVGFGIDMALKYSANGSKVNFGDFPIWAVDGIDNTNLWVHQLQVPINLRFKYTRLQGVEQYAAPFVYAGPVVSFNLSTSKCAAVEHPAASFGVQCGIGGEFFEHWQLSAGYLWGFSYQVRTVKLDNFSAAQQGWQVNLTYLF